MSPGTIDAPALRRGLAGASARLQGERDLLCELDAVAGDGDLGATLAIGCAAIDRMLGAVEPEREAGPLLRDVGLELAREAPSTIGILLGSAFISGGAAVGTVRELDAPAVAAFLESALEGVKGRGGAGTGERTIVDAMDPAASAARELVDGDAVAALAAGADAADAGARATAAMEPRHGRAAWIGDRAGGREDGGARAWALLLEGLLDGVRAEDAADAGR